jgi:prepilin-type N-terminal cleavage/methylation domain-containing protein
MSRVRGFTLIEIVIAIAIMMLVLLLAVPSLNGVLADRRLHRTLDNFGNLVHEAQARSVAEHRTYLIVQDGQNLIVRAEAFAKGEEPTIARQLKLGGTEGIKFTFPAALTREQPAQWIFWPTGTCEPAIVQFSGRDGAWTAKYSTLSAQAELMKYAAR